MRWPIRNQILLPLAAMQVVMVAVISLVAGAWSMHRVEVEIRGRLDALASTIAHASFPMTMGVLEQMKGLSEADFVVLDGEGNRLISTLPESIPIGDPPSQSAGVPQGEKSLIQLAGKRYLLQTVPWARGADRRTVWILLPETSILAARREALMGPLALGAVTLLLTTLAVALVAHRIGRRMQQIGSQVAQVADGDFRPILLPQRDDELRDLGASINRMCEGLNRMTAQIRETERTHLVKQLAAGIAHQLRNALTGARLAVQIHRGRCRQTSDESLDVALKQLSLTEEQIRGLVALVRDEHHTAVPGRLAEVVEEIALLLQPLCHHRQIALGIQNAAAEATVRDRDAIRAALLNLCLNAIEAAGTGGDVAVTSIMEGDRVVIEVSDDGAGVPPDLSDTLFDPFQTSKDDGMGLGLSLVRRAASLHNGTVHYERRGDRTVFRLTCACTMEGSGGPTAAPDGGHSETAQCASE